MRKQLSWPHWHIMQVLWRCAASGSSCMLYAGLLSARVFMPLQASGGAPALTRSMQRTCSLMP